MAVCLSSPSAGDEHTFPLNKGDIFPSNQTRRNARVPCTQRIKFDKITVQADGYFFAQQKEVIFPQEIV